MEAPVVLYSFLRGDVVELPQGKHLPSLPDRGSERRRGYVRGALRTTQNTAWRHKKHPADTAVERAKGLEERNTANYCCGMHAHHGKQRVGLGRHRAEGQRIKTSPSSQSTRSRVHSTTRCNVLRIITASTARKTEPQPERGPLIHSRAPRRIAPYLRTPDLVVLGAAQKQVARSLLRAGQHLPDEVLHTL